MELDHFDCAVGRRSNAFVRDIVDVDSTPISSFISSLSVSASDYCIGAPQEKMTTREIL